MLIREKQILIWNMVHANCKIRQQCLHLDNHYGFPVYVFEVEKESSQEQNAKSQKFLELYIFLEL